MIKNLALTSALLAAVTLATGGATQGFSTAGSVAHQATKQYCC
jgi:hypothetical protein